MFSQEELIKNLELLPDWSVRDGKMYARFTMSDFLTAMEFVNKVAFEAEGMNHHPTYTHSYLSIEFYLSTHDAGGTITSLDFKLASKISEALRSNLKSSY